MPPNDSRTLRSTKTSLDVVETIRDLDGARVTELADEMGKSPSTVHSHLATLAEEEYVVKEGDTYVLGLRFLDLGDYVQNRKSAYQTAGSYAEQLADETECRAVFAVEENGRGVYLHTHSGKHAVWHYSTLGKRFYLHQTAVGKAILSRLSEPVVDGIVDRWGLPAETENTITDRDRLVDELEEIGERGFSFNYEEQIEGVKAVGVPVNDATGRVVGAFSVASPANRMSDEWFEEELPAIALGIANEFELECSLPEDG